MANNLTGNYDAVLQVSVRQINGLLANMHQARMDATASPSFPHSGTIRIGSVMTPSLTVEGLRFRNWVTKAVGALHAATGTTVEARQMLSAKMPAGAASLYAAAWHDLDAELAGVANPVLGSGPRGRVDYQASAPSISIASGAVSEVAVHVWTRARYYADTGAGSLPAPIHGEIRALYIAQPRVLPDGRRVLRVAVTSNDQQITFSPESGTGLTAAHAETLAKQVRAVLRNQFAPVDVALGNDFAFSEFTALGSGATQALVLPLQLGNSPVPAGSLGSVTNHFLGSSEFAIAVSREAVKNVIDTLVTGIKNAAASISIILSGPLGTAYYTPTVTIDPLVWKAGVIEVSGRVDLRTPTWWAPNGWITFTQGLHVVLNEPSQTVSVVPAGEAVVDESWFISHARAVNEVNNARNKAIALASTGFTTSFVNAAAKLNDALHSFDPFSSARYRAIELTPDGLIARGAIITNRRRFDPVVHFTTTPDGTGFTAHGSWIPGGRIKTYDWTWLESGALIPWFAKTFHFTHAHDYICPKPPEVKDVHGICLQFSGSHLDADGMESDVNAGHACVPSSHEPILVKPSWWMKVMVPKWHPDPPPEYGLPQMISAHVNLVRDGDRAPRAVTTNVLVHFPGERLERPLDAVAALPEQLRRDGLSLLTLLVLPRGAFAMGRAQLEEQLGADAVLRQAEASARLRGRLDITEDYAGGWSMLFGHTGGAATYLLNARGEFVWSAEGRLDPRTVARALDEHAIEAPPPQLVPLHLAVTAGEPAPDARFVDDNGDVVTLRRLRGRAVTMVFWQSWSQPCLTELTRLQRAHEAGTAPLILAVSGGDTREELAAVREQLGLTFPLIADERQAIAGLYGVQCWPTTIAINESGLIERIQFGLAHEHKRGHEHAAARGRD